MTNTPADLCCGGVLVLTFLMFPLKGPFEITVAKSCKWQIKMNFICTFGFFVVSLHRVSDNSQICPDDARRYDEFVCYGSGNG